MIDETNIVPLHRRTRDGKRILPDGRPLDLTQYARQPDTRSVTMVLPSELTMKIDELARRDLLNRSSWIRSRLARAVESERQQATA
jgi:hypothetical protein